MIVQGIVEQANNRATAPSQYSPNGGVVHSIKVNGEWYGGMWSDPNAPEGSTVEFLAEQKGQYKNVVKDSLKVTNATPQVANTVKVNPAPAVNLRDVSIQYQSSRKDALVTLGIMVETGAIGFTDKTKTADKYDILLKLVDELAARYYTTLQEVVVNGGVDADVPQPGE